MDTLRPLFPKVGVEGSASEPIEGALARISKRKLTTIACIHCRLKKTKCDGERPSCKRCLGKSIECTYPDDADAHIRASRLTSYECLLSTLRNGSEADAEAIIHRLRQPVGSTEDSANKDRLKAIHGFVKRLQEAPDEEAVGLVTRLRSGEALDDVLREARGAVHAGESQYPTTEEAEDGVSPLDINSIAGRDQTSSSHLYAHPVVPPEEPNQLEDIFYCWNRMAVSETTRIRTAIDAFFESSEQWFLVFTKETIMRYHRDIYVDSFDRPQAVKQAELCCLCAVAAMGMRYASADEHALGYSETLYHTSTNYFALLYKILPLDAIKVCTLLANYNIKSKRITALAFVEIGLSLCLKHNLNDDNFREPGLSEDTWFNHRKTWRTLLFQSLLLSSTLGYVFGGGLFFEEFPVSDVELETVPMLHITVSRELTKLCILKANIYRMDFSIRGQITASPGSMMQDLQEWYRQLPNGLYLGALIEEQCKDKRVAIYYVNLMFLSATGLLYRRTAGRFLRSAGFVTRDAALGHSISSNYVFDNAREGILAAQQAARIFEFLVLEDVGIWKCWLVILQAYTTCTVLMHSVLQQQIHGDSIEAWSLNLQHAQSCLAILERCGPADSTISHMHNQLAALLRRVADFQPPRSSVHSAEVFLPPDYLLTIPEGSQGEAMSERIQLSMTLLVRLCGPFAFENLSEFGMVEAWGSPA
ncbi:hypothetical protein PG994_002334 [Apiospora phragmitis]|uniref:Zn(2)-C6 fungal-type domain-containing protein n=1 Tax=Apiospora phragmitis TaxID=2905665 RepID=A0ABR1WW50_9PEZI